MRMVIAIAACALAVTGAVAAGGAETSPGGRVPMAAEAARPAPPASAPKIQLPASREEMFVHLAQVIAVWCGESDFQKATGLGADDCREHVERVRAECAEIARPSIPEEVIRSRAQRAAEFKRYLECVIPPTIDDVPADFGIEELASADQGPNG